MVPLYVLVLAQTAASAKTVAVPQQIFCEVKIWEGSKLISAPKIRTLDEQSATISQIDDLRKKSYSVAIVPKVQADGNIVNMLHLTYNGVAYPGLELKRASGEKAYVAFGREKDSLSWRVNVPGTVLKARKGEIVLEMTTEALKD